MGLSTFMFNIKFIDRFKNEMIYDGTDILEGNYLVSKFIATNGTPEVIDVVYRG